eukprot:CAMPEP_0182452422 /NCGR_PEP_ID=MMETSP1172-20130603/44242_1 /TAXON_ID=708627 /ORGANISM="Timspurckia oligopyrenoides, Strain CCMP3278" /LENGTH=219 /DNA_ID=CAMNT_0024650255 /DNA_START=641 /DNA_END=1300 /DNA_ORIENTATION=-
MKCTAVMLGVSLFMNVNAIASEITPENTLNVNCPDCFGVVDGLLADCPSTWTCVSSQDDLPAHFQEPWEYTTSLEIARTTLLNAIRQQNGNIVSETDRYFLVRFTDSFGNVDVTEFYFTPNDSTVQFRSARQGNVRWDGNSNNRRLESIRKYCKFSKLPILRNRSRRFIFFESPWDSFGPTTSKNMNIYDLDPELNSTQRFDRDPLAPTPKPLQNKYAK